ncbi:MAG: helix-turn-helix transcriptional regulator [Bacteroidales bacterium]|jgi:transcriptional regulator with XRE-family HTH domain|nr:helix-turn-helix transcriptional regulator [Bacteroidales bacterium]
MIQTRIRKELEAREWNVSDLAKASRVRYASLLNFLNRKNNLSTKNLTKIFKTLGILKE